MSDPRTIRILSLDGGGERGYLQMQFFKRFVQQWGVDPATIAGQFDVITGTSIGGIMGLGMAFGMTPDELLPFFTEQGPYIFSLTSLTPSVRPDILTKVALVIANTPFYQSSGPTDEFYGYGLLTSTMESIFGTNTLQDLNTNILIPSYQFDNSTYVLYSNLNYPEFSGQNELISNIALATSAAPLYFPSWTFSGHNTIDGGVYQNNPTEFGRSLAQMIKPTANRCCILSVGTGLGEKGFDPGNPDIIDSRVDPEAFDLARRLIDYTKTNPNAPINKKLISSRVDPEDATAIEKLVALFSIASTGGQESIAKALYLESNYTLSQLYYYRFQPTLDPNKNTELDNTDTAILEYYEEVAEEWFNDDINDINTFIGHLTA